MEQLCAVQHYVVAAHQRDGPQQQVHPCQWLTTAHLSLLTCVAMSALSSSLSPSTTSSISGLRHNNITLVITMAPDHQFEQAFPPRMLSLVQK
jgi:hypothetical protein